MGDQNKLAFAKTLYETNNTNIANLADYGITPATQASFLVVINDFEKVIPKTRETTTTGATTLADFEAIVKDAQDFVAARLDKVVAAGAEDQSEFVSTYYRNRRLIDPPTRTISLKGTVKGIANSLPIKSVKIKVGSTSIKSTAKGNFLLLNKAEGTYTITFEKQGYKTLSIQIVINPQGETTVLNVVLEKV